MAPEKKYLLSFTAASMMINESVKLAHSFLISTNWGSVKGIVNSQNLLQSRTISRSIRIQQELIKRLEILTVDQLHLLTDGTMQDQKHLLWYAICKKYVFIKDFSIEVLHEKFLGMNFEVTDLDYDAFFNRKSNDHDELNKISETTKAKIKQVVFRILREADLVNSNNYLIEVILSNKLAEVLKTDDPNYLIIYPSSSR